MTYSLYLRSLQRDLNNGARDHAFCAIPTNRNDAFLI